MCLATCAWQQTNKKTKKTKQKTKKTKRIFLFTLLPIASHLTLTSSLPQPVKFPGRKMQGRASKQSIFWSYNIDLLSAL